MCMYFYIMIETVLSSFFFLKNVNISKKLFSIAMLNMAIYLKRKKCKLYLCYKDDVFDFFLFKILVTFKLESTLFSQVFALQ